MEMRIATFNVENLFARYRFKENPDVSRPDGFSLNELAFTVNDEESKKITAAAIRAVNADVICLQEVDSLQLLDRFNSQYLEGMGYTHRLLIDSHDPRLIDVAVLSRHSLKNIRTHRHEQSRDGGTWLFSRDCLEVEVDTGSRSLYLYINHFKSMIGGREQTAPRRREQTARVAELVDAGWKRLDYRGNFIVLGDFNDYPGEGTALTSLLSHPGLVNVVERLPAEERWTHYYAGGNEYCQLDFILLSKSLAEANESVPVIMLKGMPRRAKRYSGDRFENVGENYPKASDHAPVSVDLQL